MIGKEMELVMMIKLIKIEGGKMFLIYLFKKFSEFSFL